MSTVPILDQQEQKIKKTWLKLTVVRMVILPLIGSLLMVLPSFVSDLHVVDFTLVAIMPLMSILFFFILRHCTYKKFGNKFLLFATVDGGIGVYRSFLNVYKEPFNIWLLIPFVIQLSIFIAWIIYSEKVKTINKKYREQLKTLVEVS